MNSEFDDDDAWSYSFPPSTDSLALQDDKKDDNSTQPLNDKKSASRQDEAFDKNNDGKVSLIDDKQPVDSNGNKTLTKLNLISTSTNRTSSDNGSNSHNNNNNKSNNKNLDIKDKNNHDNNSIDWDLPNDLPPKDSGSKKLYNNDDHHGDDNHSSGSSSQLSENNDGIDIKKRKARVGPLAPGSTNSSLSSMSLQSPFLVKSVPANPYTTREDANSVLSKDGKTNALASDDYHTNSDSIIATNQESAAVTNMRHTIQLQASDLTILDQKHLNDELIQSKMQTSPDLTNKDSISSPTSSPKIIAYRKSSQNRRSSSDATTNIESLLEQGEKFDKKLYTKEKFKDTNYRLAVMKRNTEFHQLFRTLDLTDRLLDDFACALSREILLQGRIYISEHNVCFNSNLLGWVTNLVIPMHEIVRFEKRSTAGLFPNGILIETQTEKHVFASLLSRDITFDFMVSIWQGTTGKSMKSVNDMLNSSNQTNENENIEVSEKAKKSSNSPKFSSYMLSIDDDDEDNHNGHRDIGHDDDDDDESEDDESEDEDDDDSGMSDGSSVVHPETELPTQINEPTSKDSENSITVNSKIVKFKDESKYVNMGPDSHISTSVGKSYVPESNEVELCDEIIDAPMGVTYDILFGSNNTAFHSKFLKEHDASEITPYDNFHPMEEDPTKLERKFSYRRALNYSIGPKSTKCEVSEIIEHLNFADYIQCLTSVVTPDVPLGNSFSVKTRYLFTWGPNNTTKLKISYYILWTGRSWIKSVIEKSTSAGQDSATADLLDALKEEIKNNTYLVDGPAVTKLSSALGETTTDISSGNKVKRTKSKDKSNQSKEAFDTLAQYSFREFARNNVVLVCYFILSFLVMILILQLQILRGVNENANLMKSQLSINTNLLITLDSVMKNSKKIDYDPLTLDEYQVIDPELWDWIKSRYGKKLNHLQKVEFLATQLKNLYGSENDERNSGSLSQSAKQKLTDLKDLVKQFNFKASAQENQGEGLI